MSYKVFLITSMGAPRSHHAIFVESEPEDGAGRVYQVTGNIQTGMNYECVHRKPESLPEFVSKELMGTVGVARAEEIDSICRGVAPPVKQFDGPRRIDPTVPLRRCQEWTGEAMEAIKNAGLLES